MSEWIETKPIQKRSEQIVSFCPYCDDELDYLTMANDADSCKCGVWTEGTGFRTLYKPFEQKTLQERKAE